MSNKQISVGDKVVIFDATAIFDQFVGIVTVDKGDDDFVVLVMVGFEVNEVSFSADELERV
jgi:hypothetical protein